MLALAVYYGLFKYWDGVEALSGIGVLQRAYLNMFIMVPSSQSGRCTLILCARTLDPRMHRFVARTIVIAILLLMYAHIRK